MARQLERDHSAERCPAEVERLVDEKFTREARRVVHQRLGGIRRRNPTDDANVANRALPVEEPLIGADAGKNEQRPHAGRASSASRQISTRWLSLSPNVPTRNVISATPTTQYRPA